MTEERYKALTEHPLQILEVFNDFFGEDRVDMQGLPPLAEALTPSSFNNIFILVHFPSVKVTNEFDKFTIVNHLYAKVEIDCAGKLKNKFSLNRTEYTKLHFSNNYMHSHISYIPTDDLSSFLQPCTGSGPINNTICSLIHEFDIDIWRLFCLELDKFVHVESVAGVPYHKLESLTDVGINYRKSYSDIYAISGLSSYDLGISNYDHALSYGNIAEFVKYVIDSEELRFTYRGDIYQIALPPEKYAITLSNLFIKWYNLNYKRGKVNSTLNTLIGKHVLLKCKYNNGSLLREIDTAYSRTNYSAYVGQYVCTFKGEPKTLVISDLASENSEENTILLLSENILNYIATILLNVINYRYGNKSQSENSTNKRVIYL